jgi:hypothetical protein
MEPPFLAAATVTQQAPNTLSVIVDRGGPVRLSFLARQNSGAWLPRILPPAVRQQLVRAAASVDPMRLPAMTSRTDNDA